MDSSAFSSSRLEIHLLGRFAVYVDGQALPESSIKGRKARSLLKLIAHQRQCQMVRDQAIEVLWPELEITAAASQLYKAIHHIRKAFTQHAKDASGWIEITDDLIRLLPVGGMVTDVQRFEQSARAGLVNENISDLETAVSIYTGDFLPMDRYAEWVSLPREHYHQLFLDVLKALAEQYEKRGDLSEAAEMLRLALEKEAALETAHRGLMRIFARQGQQTRSFRQYDICREALRDELGMSPSAETKELLNDIREGRISKDEEQSTLRAMVPGPEPHIIGRIKECAKIEQQLNLLSAGDGGVLIISGEAGIGKTRLVRELAMRARKKGIAFFRGSAGENKGTAYNPFVKLFDDILRNQPGLEESLPAELGQLVPSFSGDGVKVPHADKLAAKGYLFAGVQRFFSKLAEIEPVVVIIEDLHSADRGSRELFSYLIEHRGELPILFVTTMRKEKDESVSEIVEGIEDHSPEVFELSPLSFDEHVNLVHNNTATLFTPPELARRIFRLSEGNPLFALELLKYYTEEERLDPDQYHQFDKEKLSPFPEKIPASLRYLVEQKMKELSPSANHLLNIAAIIGRQVSYELMASVWSGGDYLEEKVLFDALEEVIRSGLLEEHGLDYSFRHAIVREVIYVSISEARRQVLHDLVARRLVEISETEEVEPVEQIAHHFLHAGETIKGVEYLMRAGKRSEAIYAHDDALQQYLEAVEVLSAFKNKQSLRLKCEVLELMGDVYRACGRLEKSYEAYEEAIALAEEDPLSEPDLIELYRKMSVVAIFRTEIDRSEHFLSKAFKLVGNDARAKARLNITKALHLWHLNQLSDAYDLAQQALNLARKVDAKVEASQACEILAMTCLPLGRWEEGLNYEMQRQVYGWSPEIVVATDAHLCLWEYHVSGDQPLKQAHSFIENVAEQASKLGDLRCVAVCHYALGTMHLWRGQRSRAVDELASSLELHERIGSPAGMAYSLARKSVLHTLMGAMDLGWKAVKAGLAHAEQAAVRDHCLQRLYGVGIWNRIEAGKLEDVKELVAKSEAVLEDTGACAACALELYPWLAYYYFNTNQIPEAQKCGDAVSELAEKTGNPIGKAIATMIESNLYVTKQNEQQAEKCSRESFAILKDAVSETTHSPVVHYLNRMAEQQAELRV